MATTTAARTPSGAVALLQLTRPRLWPRNLVVTAVPLAAGALLHRAVLLATVQAFVALCLAASAGYCLNDVIDAPADARHPTKRYRPVASGRVSPPSALALSALLAVAATALAWPAASLRWVVLAYLALSALYTTRLKREPVIELVLVSAGFLLRAIAGGAATGIPVSPWFLIVTGFGSLFVVVGKRLSEFVTSGPERGTRSSLVGYTESYLRLVLGMAAAVTVAAYCLWAFGIASERVETTYAALSVVPLVVGMMRYALDVDRGRAQEPEGVISGDRVLLSLGALWAVCFWLAAMT
ncbi:decaprenyl-phosphate phosphoribosyltransferase [Terrabacter sp. NPDC080008]|uniref:decaprenyl-phosphate phosphoribosyltransferase n=1 Tax=Terrabacter sp. NPDC080008 TaxID=3155176 RepID=UPI00344FE28B